MRVLFAADLHGASLALEKAISAALSLRIDLLILSGDLAGKVLVPVVEDGGRFLAYEDGGQSDLRGLEAVKQYELTQARYGRYTVRVTREQFDEWSHDGDSLAIQTQEKIVERLHEWIRTVEKSFRGSGVTVLMSPGNDDGPYVDEVLREHDGDRVRFAERNVLDVGKVCVLSLSYVTHTPWSTYRETTEAEIARMIDELASGASGFDTCLFNLHCPPKPTKLDLATALDNHLVPIVQGGAASMTHIGSSAVREAIEKYQPIASLHGHAHESAGEIRIGRTLAVNPGSEYGQGVFRGYLLVIEGTRLVGHTRLDR